MCLPLGAVLPPHSAQGASTEPKALMWPDEHCEVMRTDGVAWEAALSRCGLWSPVVNTGHMPLYHAPPPALQMPCSPAPSAEQTPSQPLSSSAHVHVALPGQGAEEPEF